MRHGNPDADPRIKRAKREAAAAKSNLRRVIREVQAQCPHPVVAHADTKTSDYFSPLPGTRICTSCGFTEKVTWGTDTLWSGRRADPCGRELTYEEAYAPLKLAKKPIIKCSHDDLHRYRND